MLLYLSWKWCVRISQGCAQLHHISSIPVTAVYQHIRILLLFSIQQKFSAMVEKMCFVPLHFSLFLSSQFSGLPLRTSPPVSQPNLWWWCPHHIIGCLYWQTSECTYVHMCVWSSFLDVSAPDINFKEHIRNRNCSICYESTWVR